MRTKGNIRLTLHKLTPPSLLMLLRHVVKSLTGNAAFENPPIKLVDLTKIGDDLEGSITAAMKGGLAERELRNALAEETKGALTQTANYVRSVANGDRHMLSTPGFELAKSPEPIGLPLVPIMKGAVATGRTGEVDIRWSLEKGSVGSRLLKCMKDPANGGEWEEVVITTRTRYQVTGLVPYQAVWFAVTAMGAAGESAMSEPILVRAA